ncbi:hypothetical protein SRHO_G00254610 [Serrasalmus rhombeus]
MEMIELEDDRLRSVLSEGTLEFWEIVPVEKYPKVKQAAPKLLSMFGSTYDYGEEDNTKSSSVQFTAEDERSQVS